MKFHIPIQARAIVRASLEVEASSLDEAVKKAKEQLCVGGVPDVQEVSDVIWRYEELDDSQEITVKE